MMNDKLYNWLEKEFYTSNHPKYRRYFKEWVSNLTDAQIFSFERQMYNQENKVLHS